MNFRYNSIQRISKKIWRTFFPVPKSPWTMGKVEDICAINLVPPEKLKTFFSNCIKELQRIKGEDIGDYLEFGVFNGSSISSMYSTAKEQKISMRFFGFDAFQGLPKGSEKEDEGVWKEGFYACSFEQMQTCLKRKEIDPKQITWVKGWYDNTLNDKTIKKHKIKKLGIVFIDCDTYSSSKAVLDFIGPLITEPAILCFDDWKLNDLDVKGMGEYKAFNEFLENNTHLEATEIKSYNRKSKSFLIRPALTKKDKISLIGMPSAGKTSTSDILGEKLGWKVYHLDELVEEKEGRDLINIWKEKGAQYFLDAEAQMLSKLSKKENCVISPAGSIIFSEEGIKWLKENTTVVFLDTDIKTIKKRLSQKPKVVVGGENKTIEQVHKERLPLYRKYADFVVDPKGKSIEEIANEILLLCKIN